MKPVFNPDQHQAAWRKILRRFPEANFLQSPSWGEMNRLIGYRPIILQPEPHTWCLAIVKSAKRGRYLEVPGGPLLDWQNSAEVQRMFAALKTFARETHCVFIRLRPQLLKTDQHLALLASLNLRRAPMHLHAEHTVMLDLTKSEADLMKNLRRQTRYEVRRAAKLGLTVDWSNSEAIFREFERVQSDTAARQHFVPPSLRTLLAERLAFGDQARLYVARTADAQPVAYGLILMAGDEAEYFEAASTDLNRKLPGSYALQWQVIRDLKALGLKRYNLWGIAPPGAKHHRYAGVTTFKTGFGGDLVEYVPAHDLVLKPGRYLIDLAVETIRKKRRHL